MPFKKGVQHGWKKTPTFRYKGYIINHVDGNRFCVRKHTGRFITMVEGKQSALDYVEMDIKNNER